MTKVSQKYLLYITVSGWWDIISVLKQFLSVIIVMSCTLLASSALWLLQASLKILLHEQNSHHTADKRTSSWLNSFYIAKLCQNWHPL